MPFPPLPIPISSSDPTEAFCQGCRTACDVNRMTILDTVTTIHRPGMIPVVVHVRTFYCPTCAE